MGIGKGRGKEDNEGGEGRAGGGGREKTVRARGSDNSGIADLAGVGVGVCAVGGWRALVGWAESGRDPWPGKRIADPEKRGDKGG